jgi:hypothetical protein
MNLVKILIASSIALSIVGMTAPAGAADAITVEEYAQLKNEKGMAILIPYLQGAADALWSANAALQGGGKAPLYCSASGKPLSATELLQLTDRLLANLARQGKAAPRKLPVTTVAANAVVLAHPCR